MKPSRRATGSRAAGLSERKARTLWAVDVFVSACVVAPLVVGHWRGCWRLLEHYDAPPWGTFVGGAAAHAAIALARFWVNRASPHAAAGPCARLLCLVVRRIYTVLFGLACIAHWHGGWGVLDSFPRAKPLVVAVCLIALLATRTLRNALAPPYVIIADEPRCAFVFPTMFRIDNVANTRRAYLYVLDCLFSVIVVGTLVVFVWRGAWTLLDLFLFPGQPESSWASLALGYIIVAVTFAVQPLLKRLCSRLSGIGRLLVADLYLFFSFLGTVNLWRGFWNVLNEYFLTDHPLLSFWVTHLGCLLLLMLLNCSNSILVRGVYIDAEEDGGQCVDFPIHYLRRFIKERHQYTEERDPEEQLQPLEQMMAPSRNSGIVGDAAATGPLDGIISPTAVATPPSQPSNHLSIATFLSAPRNAL